MIIYELLFIFGLVVVVGLEVEVEVEVGETGLYVHPCPRYSKIY
jgi:hypothetical protein